MSNERLLGHALAAVCGLLASAVVVPTGSGDGTAWGVVALIGTLAVLVLNVAAIGVRAATRDGRWALANAGLVAVAFLGSLLALDAGYDFALTPTPNLWVQLFVCLVGGSMLVANEHRTSRA